MGWTRREKKVNMMSDHPAGGWGVLPLSSVMESIPWNQCMEGRLGGEFASLCVTTERGGWEGGCFVGLVRILLIY